MKRRERRSGDGEHGVTGEAERRGGRLLTWSGHGFVSEKRKIRGDVTSSKSTYYDSCIYLKLKVVKKNCHKRLKFAFLAGKDGIFRIPLSATVICCHERYIKYNLFIY